MDALDPDFITELMLEKMARNDHELLSMDTKDTEIKKRQAKRKAEIVKWRNEAKRGSG